MVEWNQLLHEAIERLSRGEVENAISSITEARSRLTMDISLATIGSNEYKVMQQVARLMQCAMLHYCALAKREQLREDNPLTLTYLGHALGVNAALDSLLPLMEKTSEKDYTKNEILWLSKLNSTVRENLCASVREVIRKNQGVKKAEFAQDLERSVAKIVKSVDPNVTSLRELAVDLVRQFEAGDFKQARKIFEFVRDNIQYVYDPMGFEEIQSPDTTLKLRAGDCEDQAILLSSLLSAVGFESAMIFADTDNDGVPDHVYSAVYIPEAPDYTKPFKRQQLVDGKNLHDWIPLDPASQDSDFGVIPLQDLEIVKLVQVPPRRSRLII